MKIFLIGLPGSGKTTLGKQLAERLALEFVDLDAEIEKSEVTSISEIFKLHGESHFREVEHLQLTKWVDEEKNFVMATGGGAPCFFNNIDLMNSAGVTIFLDVPAREIAKRISVQSANRPLLLNLSFEELKDKIEFLRSQRKSFYRKAKCIVKGEKLNIADLLAVVKH
ncbi:MAG: shikimate kinase [Flammeovirgaceae bacterium]